MNRSPRTTAARAAAASTCSAKVQQHLGCRGAQSNSSQASHPWPVVPPSAMPTESKIEKRDLDAVPSSFADFALRDGLCAPAERGAPLALCATGSTLTEPVASAARPGAHQLPRADWGDGGGARCVASLFRQQHVHADLPASRAAVGADLRRLLWLDVLRPRVQRLRGPRQERWRGVPDVVEVNVSHAYDRTLPRSQGPRLPEASCQADHAVDVGTSESAAPPPLDRTG